MSLNSFVTRDGGEMGRAQVVQAQACRLEPDVRMNPILLKPNTDTGSQVIVRGKPVGNMRVGEYVRYKPQAFAAAKECYDSLAAEYDAIVLEGAGTPGEVNLKSHDIVNMHMAEYAEAPGAGRRRHRPRRRLRLVRRHDGSARPVGARAGGRLDRQPLPRRREPAGRRRWTTRCAHTGRPVLGVVPYLPALGSAGGGLGRVQERRARSRPAAPRATAVEIAVIDLPHISNFTDFDAFRDRARRAAADRPLGRPS